MKQLILGGARSGKSAYAENCALATGKRLHYIATGTAGDGEMARRIAHHQQRRCEQWRVIEEPCRLAAALANIAPASSAVVVDCLTLWLSNCLAGDILAREKAALLDLLPTLAYDVFFVSNEVGSGVVPLGELSRQFVDQSGWLHQHLATLCDKVTLVVAGLPLELKPDVGS